MIRRLFVILVLAVGCSVCVSAQKKHEDTEKLGMALEYFTSGKYHEALLLFQELDKAYKLNARFRAYIGVCYYYEWEYKKAVEYLDGTIPQLDALSPHERNVYYYADAESHFYLGHYRDAIPLYERVLTVCYDNEKGDAFYRLGFCYMFLEDWENARDSFRSAGLYYKQFRNTPDLSARIIQIDNMIRGCEKKLGIGGPGSSLSATPSAQEADKPR